MTKKNKLSSVQEYQDLKKFHTIYCRLIRIPLVREGDPYHPINFIEEIEKINFSQALSSLRQAINDIIMITSKITSNELKRMDRILLENDCITLSELRIRYWNNYKHILENGYIKNETEHYLMNQLINSKESKLSEEERNKLSQMIAAYENKC